MQIAVLPMNAGPGTRASLARQISNFACEIARGATGQEIHAVNYMAQFDDEGVTRLAMVNPSEGVNEGEMVQQFFQNAPMDRIIDGLLAESESGGGTLTLRSFERGSSEALESEELSYLPGGIFGAVRGFVGMISGQFGMELPEELSDDTALFGTDNPGAFTEFLIGFDALQYVEKSQGMVAREFDPAPAVTSLKSAYESDRDWEAPYMALVQLCRLCTQHRIGRADDIETVLKSLAAAEPDDPRASFALGELAAALGNLNGAADNFELAAAALERRTSKLRRDIEAASGDEAAALSAALVTVEADQGPVLSRLGLTQAQLGMPANAERNFKKAMELEDESRPSLDLLANLLVQTGRAHEIPPMMKERADALPIDGEAQAKYALSLIGAGKEDEAMAAFESAIARMDDNEAVKRVYAPVLARKGDLDRAMDLYEDCLDAAPSEIPLLLEYATTLQQAGREFEVPKVLRDVLAANPDVNTKSQTQAWLLELEQPKRAEAVKAASEVLQAGDGAEALRQLRPLKNWLADYWKFWAIFAGALNHQSEFGEAEDAAVRLLGMFPGCEPGYGELASALSGQGRHEDAYNMLRTAMQNIPGSLQLAVNLGLAAKRSGRSDEAQHLARQIREATGDQAELAPLLSEMES